jgi:hypothetical protein
MTAMPDSGARIIDLATPPWCWAQLRSATEGILSYRSARGLASLAVTYTLTDRQIVIPIAAYNGRAHLAIDTEVTLALTGQDDEGLRWVVRATGIADLAVASSGSGGLTACRQSHPAHGAASRANEALLLPVARLRGFYETSLHAHDDCDVPDDESGPYAGSI